MPLCLLGAKYLVLSIFAVVGISLSAYLACKTQPMLSYLRFEF